MPGGQVRIQIFSFLTFMLKPPLSLGWGSPGAPHQFRYCAASGYATRYAFLGSGWPGVSRKDPSAANGVEATILPLRGP